MQRYIALPLIVLVAVIGLSAPAGAQLIMNPSSLCDVGGVELGPALGYSKITYTGDGDGDMDVERTLTGIYGAWGLNDWFDVYVALGFIAKAEPEADDLHWNDSGNGFLADAGIRGVNYENDLLSVMSYAQVSFISEDYGETSEEGVKYLPEAEIFEATLGAIVKGYVADRLAVYGGLEFTPYTDGKVKVKTQLEGEPSHTESDEIERNTPITLRAGANYEFDRWWLRGEIGLIGETSFLLAGTVRF